MTKPFQYLAAAPKGRFLATATLCAALLGCATDQNVTQPKLSNDIRRQKAEQYLRDADAVILFRGWDDIRVTRPAITFQGEFRKLNRQSLESALKLMRPANGLATVQFDVRYNDNHNRPRSEYPDLADIRRLVQSAGFKQVVFVGAGAFGDFLIQQ